MNKKTFLLTISFGLIFVGATISLIHAQSLQTLQDQQTAAQNCITSNANSTATCQSQLSSVQQAILTYNQINAQTAAQVNWDYVDGLEIAGIRYAQWSAAETSVNWSSIVPTLGVNCSVQESNVNWYNMPNCEAKGVAMGSPYGNWPTGVAGFWCGQGSISGVC
jgi:hypothetical protein